MGKLGKAFRHNSGSVVYIQKWDRSRDAFDSLNSKDLIEEIGSINVNTARSMAYQDAYGLIFMLSKGKPVGAIGDLRVTRSLIERNLLKYDPQGNSLEPGPELSVLVESGPVRTDEDGRTYQALLKKSRN